MVHPELLEYIRSQTAAGVTEEELIQELLAAGWDQKQIQEAFNLLISDPPSKDNPIELDFANISEKIEIIESTQNTDTARSLARKKADDTTSEFERQLRRLKKQESLLAPQSSGLDKKTRNKKMTRAIFIFASVIAMSQLYKYLTGNGNQDPSSSLSVPTVGISDERYTVSQGSAKDEWSGLMWQQILPVPQQSASFQEAASICDNLVIGHNEDWRLPTGAELETLTESCRINKANIVFNDQLLPHAGTEAVYVTSDREVRENFDGTGKRVDIWVSYSVNMGVLQNQYITTEADTPGIPKDFMRTTGAVRCVRLKQNKAPDSRRYCSLK